MNYDRSFAKAFATTIQKEPGLFVSRCEMVDGGLVAISASPR